MHRALTIGLSLTPLLLLLVIGSGVLDDEASSPHPDYDALRTQYSADPADWPAPEVADSIDWEPLGPLPDPPVRSVDSLDAVVELGKTLFFDPRLSSSDQISCASCHDPEWSWGNARSVGIGHDHQEGERNVPSLANIWAMETLFWDGRAETLEEQAAHPIEDPTEMNMDLEALPAKLEAIEGYAPLFAESFGDPTVTTDRILRALAQFQRTIKSRTSDFDRFLNGRSDALSDEALHGLHLFRTEARCMNCHHGPRFTDEKFHNLGLHFYGRPIEDLGRYDVTGNPDDMGRFRTPSLRDVAHTGPWMHNGMVDKLSGVLVMYNNGMVRPRPNDAVKDEPHFPQTSPLLEELDLTDDELDALEAFLESISALPFRRQRPELPQ